MDNELLHLVQKESTPFELFKKFQVKLSNTNYPAEMSLCLSLILNDLGRYPEAKALYEEAKQMLDQNKSQELQSLLAYKHAELSGIYEQLGRIEEAIKELSLGVSLSPKNLDLRIRRAQLYVKKGWTHRSFQELYQLKTEFPTHELPSFHLGNLHFAEGNCLDAELEWERALSLKPDHQPTKDRLENAKKQRS